MSGLPKTGSAFEAIKEDVTQTLGILKIASKRIRLS